MLTFQKTKYSDLPDQVQKRVISWSDKEILFDETGLSPAQIQRITDFLTQEGYKQV